MNEFEIKILPFNENKLSNLIFDNKRFDNWPVVYMLDNSEEIYIGETANIVNRVSSHAKDPFKSKLENLNVIYHPEVNKSVVLHFEAKLIGHLSGLSKQIVINRNLGQSITHNYFDKKKYDQLYIELWEALKNNGLVQSSIKQIENLATFKYSPFKSLDKQQMNIIHVLIDTLQNKKENTKSQKVKRW
jgi:predicted GIY-YIG superfamily endonuclease